MKILIITLFAIGYVLIKMLETQILKNQISKQLNQEFNDQIQRERLLMVASHNQAKIDLDDEQEETTHD